jgi:hypothetical protein
MNQKLKLKIIEKYGSQVRFAFENNENEALVSKVINGWRVLDPKRQNSWAKALGCKPKDIFSDEG